MKFLDERFSRFKQLEMPTPRNVGLITTPEIHAILMIYSFNN